MLSSDYCSVPVSVKMASGSTIRAMVNAAAAAVAIGVLRTSFCFPKVSCGSRLDIFAESFVDHGAKPVSEEEVAEALAWLKTTLARDLLWKATSSDLVQALNELKAARPEWPKDQVISEFMFHQDAIEKFIRQPAMKAWIWRFGMKLYYADTGILSHDEVGIDRPGDGTEHCGVSESARAKEGRRHRPRERPDDAAGLAPRGVLPMHHRHPVPLQGLWEALRARYFAKDGPDWGIYLG